MHRLLFLLGTVTFCLATQAQVLINEVDCNQVGTDTGEFVEIYDGGIGNSPLTNLTLVFYNGNANSVYAAYDLSSYSTNAEGYFVAGNVGLSPAPALVIPNDSLQNGTDAVALFFAPASNFSVGEPLTTEGLIDALVYTVGEGQNLALEVLLGPGQEQVDEASGGNSDGESMQRCPDGSGGARNTLTYATAPPTPGVENNCATLIDIVINEVDPNTPGEDTAEFIELFDGGAGNTSLTGLCVVLYNGGFDASYAVYDLDGKKTDANGYFVIGAAAVSPDMLLNSAGLQNGPDAVAVYAANAADFPNETPVVLDNLLTALVYASGSVDDGLAPLINALQPQPDENIDGLEQQVSMQRCPNGAGNPLDTEGFENGPPTPGAANDCPDSAPVADFTWSPTIAYAGQAVDFTDRSTGPPVSWQWTFNGAVFPSAFVQNPMGIEFVEAGTFDVQLSVANPMGNNTTSRYITVLDPAPSATSLLVSPNGLTVCEEGTFLALGVLGRPPLTYTWDLITPSDVSVFTGGGNPLNFTVPGSVPAGTYRARLTLDNSADTTVVLSNSFQIAAPAGASVTLAPAIAAESNINNFPLVVTFSQPVTGFGLEDLVITNGTAAAFAGDGANYGFELTAAAEGEMTVRIVAGAADNVCGLPSQVSAILTLRYDVTAPLPTLAPVIPGTNTAAPVQFQLTSNEPLETPNALAFTVGNGAISGISGGGTAITVEVTPAVNGDVTLTLPQGNCVDLAGNPAAEELSATVLFVSAESQFHTADQDQDNKLSLSELLRIIQFYNGGGLQCATGTEDGYTIGQGNIACTPHASDYNPQDWFISLTELLRVIQFYNLNGYYRCEEETEDGFCGGTPVA